MDPNVIDRFAASSPDDGARERDDELDYARDVEPYLARLPPLEADIIELYHRRSISQRRIGALLGIRQPAVLKRLRRARARIRLWRSLPDVTERQARADLEGILSRDDVRVLLDLTYELAQAPVARRLSISRQSLYERWARIRSAIERARAEPYLTLVAAVPRRRKASNGTARAATDA